MPILGYDTWRRFAESVERASIACKNSGHDPEDHFVGVGKVITGGKGAQQTVEDYRLSRYACYLTAMNGDPRKPEIALAQTYFAIKTREAELGTQHPTPTALISARLIAQVTGQSPKAVSRALKRHGVLPTHHFLEPLCRAPAYLWPLEDIKAFYDAWELPRDFTPFTGEVRPGVAAVERMFVAAQKTKNQRKTLPQPFTPLSEAERIGAQLARELTEEFIRTELPNRLRAVLRVGASA
ncbi:hypothetical protein DKM44_12985 [Deinococcus irradiatisoli]|uniref:DNA damage-inducible protein D n=1 Tax=Deinococcus irradiatisoli TaxID=2202254 RepID=A0A2Z3JJ73_9DEIO|nr:hypothetical protein DKM44_12985 [Deinococcus irradiatisoli]